MSAPDADVLAWAASQGRQVFSRDRKTMTLAAWDRVAHGLPMPGLFIIPERMPVGQAVTELELIATASEPDERQGQVTFLQL